MGLRLVRKVEDPILLKKSREIKDINPRILQLLDDMVDTMKEENGIGLSAPQVGILRRCFVCEVEEGQIYKIINPEIIESSDEKVAIEGCLSIPNYNATVKRPEKIKMKYLDIEGKEQVIEAEGLLARCFQHETDHLDGILINSKYIDIVTDENYDEIVQKYDLNKKDEIEDGDDIEEL